MQKYTALKELPSEQNTSLAPTELEISLLNGHHNHHPQEEEENEMDKIDYITSEEQQESQNTVMPNTSQHYTNKANMAKLQWWNTPTPRLTIDDFNNKPIVNGSVSPTTTPPTAEDEFKSSARELTGQQQHHLSDNSLNAAPRASPNSHYPQHSHQQMPQFYNSEADVSPLSKSASSSRHRIHQQQHHHHHHHHSASSIDNISPKLRLTNQFSIDEEPDPNKQDSQLLLNGK